jgi:hypothetical protein
MTAVLSDPAMPLAPGRTARVSFRQAITNDFLDGAR